ncbi:hypothetical protein [Sediminibacillus albus]|uniref:YhfM-like domain-containing protein n=1 Tax=Sediminibacillus albus TaxID=407036 RepID=A0A1G8Y3K3_9BACI|nr:hypothetical protein [Sediminibacillus albus]SDJ97243.1 hypothetical protein SAMN05216243_1380 [Sediminibacillus albus]
MRKLLLLLAVCSATLTACQSQSENMPLLDNVSSISVSESKGYGGLNENYFVTFNEPEVIWRFKNIIKEAEPTKKDITNETPNYDILVRYQNGDTHGLHLLLGDEGEDSIFMYIGKEKNAYFVSPEDTGKLAKLIDVK